MGAWGIGNFQNDDAADWVDELERSEDVTTLFAALQEIQSNRYLEAPECSVALAAAEVVAALLGAAPSNLPDRVTEWVRQRDVEVEHDLLALARRAVVRVRSESELRDLWAETNDFDKWEAGLEDLLRRLGAG